MYRDEGREGRESGDGKRNGNARTIPAGGRQSPDPREYFSFYKIFLNCATARKLVSAQRAVVFFSFSRKRILRFVLSREENPDRTSIIFSPPLFFLLHFYSPDRGERGRGEIHSRSHIGMRRKCKQCTQEAVGVVESDV